MAAPYRPPGVILMSGDYYVRPVGFDDSLTFDFLKLTLIVKEYELISEEGEIVINGITFDTKRPIQLVEGDNIIFGVNPTTNQITIDTKMQGDPGLVGTKMVNEKTIGQGKVLSFDERTNKLIYIDITQMVEDVVNEILDEVVSSTVQEAITKVINTVIPNAVNDKVNEIVQGVVNTTVENVVPEIVDEKVNKLVPITVENSLNQQLPPAVEEKVNQILPTMVNDKVEETVNNIVPEVVNPAVSLAVNEAVPKAVQEAIDALPKEKLISKEIPIGDVDGNNTVFQISEIPIEESEYVYVNGVLQEDGKDEDYIISGSIITFTYAPPINAKIRVSYKVKIQ